MRQTIDTAPRDGEFVIIVDGASGCFDVARWSASREWVRESGEPSKIAPSHWDPIGGEKSHKPAEKLQSSPIQDEVTPLAPFKPAALEYPDDSSDASSPILVEAQAPSAPVEEQTAAIYPKRGLSGRQGFLLSCVIALVAVGVIGWYWRAEVRAHTTTGINALHYFEEQIQLASQGWRKVGLSTAQLQVTSDRGITPTLAQDGAKLQQSGEMSVVSARQLGEINQRVEVLSTELAEARRINDMFTAQLRTQTSKAQSLEQERDKAGALARQAGTERQELLANVEQFRKAVEAEQALVSALTSELTTVRRDLEAKTMAAAKADEEIKRTRQVAEAERAELRQSLQQERDRAAALARDLERQRTIGVRTNTAKGQLIPAAPVSELTAGELPELQATPEAARLIARASTLLARGDIGAARIVLESAVDAGSAKASFALAETYDPNILTRWGTYGTRGDASKAREFYEKATIGGIREAKDRINALRQ